MASAKKGKQVKVNKPEVEEVNNSSELIQIEQELEDINPKVFKGIPVEQKKELLRAVVSIKHHSGPLPDPETLAEYSRIISDGANRIMLMAEKQQDHRIELEKTAITSQLSQAKKGQIFGFIITILIVICGTYLALNGHEKTGIVLIGTTLVALAGIFVLGKFTKQKST